MEANNGADQDLNNFNYDYNEYSPIDVQDELNPIIQPHSDSEPSHHDHPHSNDELSIDAVADMLNCFICLKKVKDAVICPYCSKFSCEGCLRAWIGEKKQECPMCRHSLSLNQIIKCRFLNDVSKILESIKPQLHQNFKIHENNENVDKCNEHQMKMIYYCLTCSKVICSDCVMFTKAHEGHKFERIRSVYDKKVDALSREMTQIKRKIDEYDTYLLHLLKQSDTLKKSKEDKVKDLLSLYRTLNGHLDNELSLRLQRIEEEKRKVEDELEYFENMHSDMATQLKVLSPAKVIHKSGEFLKVLAEINAKKFLSTVPKNIVSDFGNSISIRYAMGSFSLKPYSIYKNSNEIVYSDSLVADGITWRIKIYPNGTGAYKNIYLSLFVEMVKGWNQGGSYCYKIALVKPVNENENVEREYVSEFENSICWGYNRFIKIEDLENQGFLDREKDQITLRYFIRPAHHLQKISDQTEYISYLENSMQKEKSYNKKLKQKVRIFEKNGPKNLSESEILKRDSQKNKGDEGDLKNGRGVMEISQVKFEQNAEEKGGEEDERISVEGSETEEPSRKNQNCIVDNE